MLEPGWGGGASRSGEPGAGHAVYGAGGGVSRSSRVSESNFIRMELSYPDPCYTLLA